MATSTRWCVQEMRRGAPVHRFASEVDAKGFRSASERADSKPRILWAETFPANGDQAWSAAARTDHIAAVAHQRGYVGTGDDMRSETDDEFRARILGSKS